MNDSIVKCEVCGKTQQVSFGTCLRTGWPLCHGYTMTLITHPTAEQIDQAVCGCIGKAVIQLKNTEGKKL